MDAFEAGELRLMIKRRRRFWDARPGMDALECRSLLSVAGSIAWQASAPSFRLRAPGHAAELSGASSTFSATLADASASNAAPVGPISPVARQVDVFAAPRIAPFLVSSMKAETEAEAEPASLSPALTVIVPASWGPVANAADATESVGASALSFVGDPSGASPLEGWYHGTPTSTPDHSGLQLHLTNPFDPWTPHPDLIMWHLMGGNPGGDSGSSGDGSGGDGSGGDGSGGDGPGGGMGGMVATALPMNGAGPLLMAAPGAGFRPDEISLAPHSAMDLSTSAPRPDTAPGPPGATSGTSTAPATNVGVAVTAGPHVTTSASVPIGPLALRLVTNPVSIPVDSRGVDPPFAASSAVSAPAPALSASSAAIQSAVAAARATVLGATVAAAVETMSMMSEPTVDNLSLPLTQGSDLLSNFLPVDGGSLTDAVDQFLARIDHLGAARSGADETPEYALWPTAWAAALVSLELGRRWRKRRADGEPDDAQTLPATGPGGPLAGWPGSWSVKVP